MNFDDLWVDINCGDVCGRTTFAGGPPLKFIARTQKHGLPHVDLKGSS